MHSRHYLGQRGACVPQASRTVVGHLCLQSFGLHTDETLCALNDTVSAQQLPGD